MITKPRYSMTVVVRALLVGSMIILGLFSCKTPKQLNSQPLEFTQVRSIAQRATAFPIVSIDQLKLMIHYDVFEVALAGRFPYHLKGMVGKALVVRFGPLDNVRFQAIKTLYGNRSAIEYQQGEVYFLRDFLPPLMQATLNHRFHKEIVLAGNKEQILGANCWGTTYEVLRRQSSEFSIFYASPTEILRRLFDPQFSRLIRESKKISDLSLTHLKFGDAFILSVVEVYEKFIFGIKYGETIDRELFHTAVFVDDNLFYEKSGFNNAFTYRLVSGDWLREQYPNLTGTIRRFNRSRLPPPDKLDGFVPDEALLRQVRIEKGPLGRSVLEKAAYDPLLLKISR